MGFFDLKANCAVCDGETGLNRYRIAEKNWMCTGCFKKANFKITTPVGKMTADDVKNAISRNTRNIEDLGNFSPTKKIGSYVEFDNNQRKWLVLSSVLGKRNKSIVYDYDEILSFELLEDGESIASGGLGRAAVGGVLFGGAGAIVGGVTGKKKTRGVCTSLKIKVTLNDISNPAVYITFLETKTKKDGFVYKSVYKDAQECLSTFQIICDKKKNEATNIPLASAADEIKKFKALFDEGIISEDEFNKKKQALLG